MKNTIFYTLAISLCWVLSSPVLAQIYKWVDKNGVQHFSSQPPPKGAKSETVNIKYQRNQTTPDENSKTGAKNVVMYSTEWCGVCKKAKRYFRKNNIKFVEHDIEKSFQAKLRFKKLGGSGVPLIQVGTKTMKGFDANRFKKLYGS